MNSIDPDLTGRALTLVRPPAVERDAQPGPPRPPVVPAGPGWREIAACTVGLGVLAVIVFGPHVARGGFSNDDWYLAATYQFAREPRFVGALDALSWMAFRPAAMIYFVASYALFGTDPTLHLAWALALGVGVSAALYTLLRLLDFPAPHAAAVAGLVLLFPWSNSTRLWASASIVNLGILLFLLGMIVALRDLRREGRSDGRRHPLAGHRLVLVCYVLAVLAYEITAPAIACTALLYARRAPRRVVLWRWAADVLATVTALVVVTWVARSAARIGTLEQHVRRANTFARESAELLARSALPVGRPTGLLSIALVAAAAGSAWVVRRAPATDPRRCQVLLWLSRAGAGVGVVAVGYLPFVPARLWVYGPLVHGQGNRVNALASVGFVLVIHSLAVASATAALGHRSGQRSGDRVDGRDQRGHGAAFDGRAWSTAAALTVAGLIGVGYAVRVQPDVGHWDEATRVQKEILSQLGDLVPDPPPGSVIVPFGHRQVTAAGVTTFATPWDLDGAVKLAWDDPTLSAYPLLWGANLGCQPSGFTVPGMAAGPPGSITKRVALTGLHRKSSQAPYDRALLVDLRAGRLLPIGTEADCWRARDRVTAVWTEIPRPASPAAR